MLWRLKLLVLLVMLLGDHLALGKIADHNSSLNQFVGDKVGSLMQAIPLLVALLVGDTLIHLGEVSIASGFLLTSSTL